MTQVITDGRLLSGALSNILRGITPTATLWDGQIGFAYQAKTGGTVFTDFSAAANNATANDVTFFDATMQLNDAFYFGENFSTSGPFNSLLINTGTAANVSATLVWEYYDSVGTAWTAIPGISDLTVGLTVTGSKYVTWPDIATMGHVAVNAQDRYWVRLRVSAFTSKTTAPLGTQIWLGRYPTNLTNITDGDATTVCNQGTVLMGAAGNYGLLLFDLGAVKTFILGGRVAVWSSANSIGVWASVSNDNITYDDESLNNQSDLSVTSATVRILQLRSKIYTGRYIKYVFYAGAAATVNAKVYTIRAYEVSS